MLNRSDLDTWRDEMITVAQAKDALEKLFECYDIEMYHQAFENQCLIEEFIKQYEDWVKVKTMTHGALLKGKEDS